MRERRRTSEEKEEAARMGRASSTGLGLGFKERRIEREVVRVTGEDESSA